MSLIGLLNKKLTKKIFLEHGVQTNVDALQMLEKDMRMYLERRAKLAKHHNIKRVTANTYQYIS